MLNKKTRPVTTIRCAHTQLHLIIHDLLDKGLTHTRFAQVKTPLETASRRLQQQLIEQVIGKDVSQRKAILNSTREDLVNLCDLTFQQIRLVSKKHIWVTEYYGIIQELKKILGFIESKWKKYCTDDIKELDKTLFDTRPLLLRRFITLKKQSAFLEGPLGEALLQPIYHFLTTKDTQYITRGTTQYIMELFTQTEQLAVHYAGRKALREEDIISLLLNRNFNAALFIDYYKLYLSAKTETHENIADKTAFLEMVGAEIAHIIPAPGQRLQAESPCLREILLPWIDNFILLQKKRAQLHSNKSNNRKDTGKLEKIIYKESGAVVAEFYKMLTTCCFCEAQEFSTLLQTLAAFCELPQTKDPSPSYMYVESRRNSKKAKKVLRGYLPLFAKYLEEEAD